MSSLTLWPRFNIMAWQIIDWGNVPTDSPVISYECLCGAASPLPVVGLALAQIGHHDGHALVFEPGRHEVPREIRCTKCRRHLVLQNRD